MKKRIAALIIAGGVLALAMAGCGSGGQALGLESNAAAMQDNVAQAAAIKPSTPSSSSTITQMQSSGQATTASR